MGMMMKVDLIFADSIKDELRKNKQVGDAQIQDYLCPVSLSAAFEFDFKLLFKISFVSCRFVRAEITEQETYAHNDIGHKHGERNEETEYGSTQHDTTFTI